MVPSTLMDDSTIIPFPMVTMVTEFLSKRRIHSNWLEFFRTSPFVPWDKREQRQSSLTIIPFPMVTMVTRGKFFWILILKNLCFFCFFYCKSCKGKSDGTIYDGREFFELNFLFLFRKNRCENIFKFINKIIPYYFW